MNKRVYISGPITNDPDYKRKFEAKKMELIEEGYDVVNPAGLDGVITNASWEEYMRIDLALIDMCEYICMLHNWQKSPGACMEYGYAIASGKTVLGYRGIY